MELVGEGGGGGGARTLFDGLMGSFAEFLRVHGHSVRHWRDCGLIDGN